MGTALHSSSQKIAHPTPGGPSEADVVLYFRVTPPTAHSMLVKLEELGLVTRKQGIGRSVRVTLPEKRIPVLKDVQGPPW